MEYPAKVNFKVRNLILDYALGAAIVALLPIPKIGLLQAIALVVLNVFTSGITEATTGTFV